MTCTDRVLLRATEVLFLLPRTNKNSFATLPRTSSDSCSPCFHFSDSVDFYDYENDDDDDDEANIDEQNVNNCAGGERSAAWQQLPPRNSTGEAANSAGGPGRLPGCPYCGKELRNMTRHIEDVHCPVEVACQLCGKICTSRNKLRTHMAQVCNKRFNVTT